MQLRVTLDFDRSRTILRWISASTAAPVVEIEVTLRRIGDAARLVWAVTQSGRTDEYISFATQRGVQRILESWRQRCPVQPGNVLFFARIPDGMPSQGSLWENAEQGKSFGADGWIILEESLAQMADELKTADSPMERMIQSLPAPAQAALARKARRLESEMQRKEEQQKARLEARLKRIQREAFREKKRRVLSPPDQSPTVTVRPALEIAHPIPPVPVRFEKPVPSFSRDFMEADSPQEFLLRERASLWWVSNQSDDLLSLPYCAIERLEYQMRTALKVIGPLRGRALLSDEVGLGKTIEAGLVLKEYLMRGMVKRFLVLTVPSLVDQWAEELESKFNLATVTTNQPAFRSDPSAFWTEYPAIVASLHTLKLDPHLDTASRLNWDLLIVDEAHYLRNRDSKAWQAVNRLPRQFMLLLTATPVQNSIEELYHLVTLLKPGQLPSPKDFRARYVNPDRPREPREPEELRGLLGQVMIRNTRANANVSLPPRRAETVLFDPSDGERGFWEGWDKEFRATLNHLAASQQNLWGRLLLQAAGSSPSAWRGALESFPDADRARRWRETALPEESWKRKVAILPPLAKTEGGLVIFTQFLQTQAALARELQPHGLPIWTINGQTPPPERQPITEKFRHEGGVLLLTQSGTEGRNLQFCHRLVNFDLPWNPMVIEQRIGRLHRLGQKHAVEIYNLVPAGTLQAHLLEILQEKLNLFELVVGETGIILGDRFASDDFEEEVFRRWKESEGRVAEAFEALGQELQTARTEFEDVKKLDTTLFSHDYETL